MSVPNIYVHVQRLNVHIDPIHVEREEGEEGDEFTKTKDILSDAVVFWY